MLAAAMTTGRIGRPSAIARRATTEAAANPAAARGIDRRHHGPIVDAAP
ncbi:MAG: hypothetical protein QOF49_1430, partial [Chloroflexota bacterium]|nr:hypothetical protein [Chloroflexota bacterium]